MRCLFHWMCVVVLVIATGRAVACPKCAEAMQGSRTQATADPATGDAVAVEPPKAGLADGFYWSILFMLAVPYTLAGVGGYAIYRAVKQRQPASPPAA